MKSSKIVGRIEPLIEVRIKHKEKLIAQLCRRFFPDPPAHLEESVYKAFNVLCKQRKMLIDRI